MPKFGGTMNVHSFLSRKFHSSRVRLAAIVLLALAWSSPAFCSPLEKAIKKGDLEQVKALIEADPSLISKKKPLAMAAQYCKKDIAEYLISQHAEVDQREFLGLTPLFDAAQSGCADVVQVLLVHGANPNAKNISGETVMWWANQTRNNSRVTDLLRLFGGK
jgi:ankyrin repeat protein